jgi:hypothetical protein
VASTAGGLVGWGVSWSVERAVEVAAGPSEADASGLPLSSVLWMKTTARAKTTIKTETAVSERKMGRIWFGESTGYPG